MKSSQPAVVLHMREFFRVARVSSVIYAASKNGAVKAIAPPIRTWLLEGMSQPCSQPILNFLACGLVLQSLSLRQKHLSPIIPRHKFLDWSTITINILDLPPLLIAFLSKEGRQTAPPPNSPPPTKRGPTKERVVPSGPRRPRMRQRWEDKRLESAQAQTLGKDLPPSQQTHRMQPMDQTWGGWWVPRGTPPQPQPHQDQYQHPGRPRPQNPTEEISNGQDQSLVGWKKKTSLAKREDARREQLHKNEEGERRMRTPTRASKADQAVCYSICASLGCCSSILAEVSMRWIALAFIFPASCIACHLRKISPLSQGNPNARVRMQMTGLVSFGWTLLQPWCVPSWLGSPCSGTNSRQ